MNRRFFFYKNAKNAYDIECMFSLPELSNILYNVFTILLKYSHFHFFENSNPQIVTNQLVRYIKMYMQKLGAKMLH